VNFPVSSQYDVNCVGAPYMQTKQTMLFISGNYRFYSTEKDEAKKNENKNEDKNKNEDEKKKDDGKKTDEDKKHVNTTELLRITNSLDFCMNMFLLDGLC
jgi:hypothetical protein